MRERTAAASPRRRPEKPPPAPDTSGPSPREMDDDVLSVEYTKALAAGDEERAAAIERELDRRDQADDGFVSEEDAEAFLDTVASGKRRSEREQAKDAYQDWVHAQYLQAVEATNGALLSKAGKAAGVDEMSLFTGALQRSQLKKYASEELLRWFAGPGSLRMTETDFIKQWTGTDSTKDRDRLRSPLSEF